MTKAREISLFITILVWATIIGAVTYSHVAFFSSYLSHLPDSTVLINGPHAIHDEKFWMAIHPLAIITLLTTLVLNWNARARRRFILITVTIYALALIATFTYFVPELKAFAKSHLSTISAEEWLERGKIWDRLSWTRGFFMYVGFLMLVIALSKPKSQNGLVQSAGA